MDKVDKPLLTYSRRRLSKVSKPLLTYSRRRLSTRTELLVNNHVKLPSQPDSSTKVTQESEIWAREESRAGLLEKSTSLNLKASSTIKMYTQSSKFQTKKGYDTVQGQDDVPNNVQSTNPEPARDLGNRQSLASPDMSAHPAASCDPEIQQLDSGCQEHGPNETPNGKLSLGSAGKKMSMIRTQNPLCSSRVGASSKNCEQHAGSLATPSSTSLNTNSIQLFEERSSDVTPPSITSQSLVALDLRNNQLNLGSGQSLPLVAYPYAPYSPFQSSPLVLTGEGSALTNRSHEFGANVWSDAELDSLWVGVRRHGLGNWDRILGDRRLNFMPWRRPHQLAQRWEVEQSFRQLRDSISHNLLLPNDSSVAPVVVPSAGGLRFEWPNQSIGGAPGSTQQPPSLYQGSFTSLLRQVEANALQAPSVNTQVVTEPSKIVKRD